MKLDLQLFTTKDFDWLSEKKNVESDVELNVSSLTAEFKSTIGYVELRMVSRYRPSAEGWFLRKAKHE